MGKIDAFAAVVAENLPAVTSRIPPTPAAELGRLEPEPALSGVAEALRWSGPLLAERVLGALELRLDDLPTHAHGLVTSREPTGGAMFATLSGGDESEAFTAVTVLDAIRPGVTDLITDLVVRLTRHPALAEHFTAPAAPTAPATGDLPTWSRQTIHRSGAARAAMAIRIQGPNPTVRQVPPDVHADEAATRAARENLLRHARRTTTQGGPRARPRVAVPARRGPRPPIVDTPEARAETAQAARHAAPHLALSLITAHAVLTELGAATPAAVVGTALGVTALHLPTLAKPAAYTEAAQTRRRAEYVLPAMSSGHAEVRAHHFTLAEGPTPDTVDFSANGLVAVTENGVGGPHRRRERRGPRPAQRPHRPTRRRPRLVGRGGRGQLARRPRRRAAQRLPPRRPPDRHAAVAG